MGLLSNLFNAVFHVVFYRKNVSLVGLRFLSIDLCFVLNYFEPQLGHLWINIYVPVVNKLFHHHG